MPRLAAAKTSRASSAPAARSTTSRPAAKKTAKATKPQPKVVAKASKPVSKPVSKPAAKPVTAKGDSRKSELRPTAKKSSMTAVSNDVLDIKLPPPPKVPTITPPTRSTVSGHVPGMMKPASVPPPAPVVAARAPSTYPAPMIRPPNKPPSVLPKPIQMPTPPKDISFKVGDKAVHPHHGLTEVVAIEEKDLGGTRARFYIMRLLHNDPKKDIKVMVPTNAAVQVGLRSVMSEKEAEAVIETMRAKEVAVDLQPWSRRFRAYTEMIRSGAPHEIAKVLRDMHRLKFDKDLSFGERKLLDDAKSLLLKELALAKKMSEDEMAGEVADIFKA